MRSAWQRCGWGGVLLIAVFGCSGGQTGQPDSGFCEFQPVRADRAIDGVSPEAFAAAFEGSHAARLVWNVPEAAGMEDVLTLALSRPDATEASVDCSHTVLEVKLDLELRTSNHGLLEIRTVALRGELGQARRAEILTVDGRVRLDADLTVVGQVEIAGTIRTGDVALPARSATISSLVVGGGE